MCGIIGYVGNNDAIPVILDGLRKLEYRGYDSAGVAILPNAELWLEKKEGRLSVLEESLSDYPKSSIGIGHTRWATHGVPSDVNSHPHTDCGGRFAVIHNGIIENYARLRAWLKQEGHIFASETDTEVLAHLIETCYQGDLVEAVHEAVSHLEGAYAFAVLSQYEPDKIVAVRKDSPMIIGLGQDEYFLASDIPAILGRTDRVYVLDDGEMAVLDRDGVVIYDADGEEIIKDVFKVTWDPIAAEKAGYPHFMIKEIHEQPRALRDTLRGRIQDGKVDLSETGIDKILAGVEKLYIVACGTAYHAGMVGKYVIEKLARIPVEVDIASEFRYRDVLWGKNNALMVISQSGETADTLAALRDAKKRGIKTIAVTNVVGSSAARDADAVLLTLAGPEIAVASTKAYVTQLLAMYLIGIHLAGERQTLPAEVIAEMLTEITALPDAVEAILAETEQIEAIAEKYKEAANAFFLGRGLDHAVGLEGALKMKEISYIHAEAYAAGELKHGTLALIEPGVPAFCLVTQDHLVDKMVSNIEVVRARGGAVIGITKRSLSAIAEEYDEVVYMPECSPIFSSILSVVPLQLLAYYVAVARGCDVDKPRNLAKSVTVE